ncbi:hypothetical protein PLEOSDRAFT_171159 [Pleurotus ostreatus PC15]|uniref:Uncharacterized protein n=1 Tax=Pleurotus ostreatus (strain PC15) TaxID=1137138 RepID=A0A067N9A9_PLEO1|nr:hypothetical protein PLEOSDRAFT_171159 [Pleurotus ostreatus PC15]
MHHWEYVDLAGSIVWLGVSISVLTQYSVLSTSIGMQHPPSRGFWNSVQCGAVLVVHGRLVVSACAVRILSQRTEYNVRNTQHDNHDKPNRIPAATKSGPAGRLLMR